MKTIILFIAVMMSSVCFANLEQGLSITNIQSMKLLEAQGFSIGSLLSKKVDGNLIDNEALSVLPAFNPVYKSLRAEVAAFSKNNAGTGVGMKFEKRLFDAAFLNNSLARFALVGVVNRMDQAFKDPNACGELRFIYRLAYKVGEVSSRLPMTINLIFKNKKQNECSDLAQAWKDIDVDASAEDIAKRLIEEGPLSTTFFDRSAIDRLETNLQIVRWPAAVRGDFGGHAEYLLKVYKWDNGVLAEDFMENQIDRKKLNANPALLLELKKWLRSNVESIDKGTMIIPEKFLTKTAFSISPGGINRSANRPFYNYFSLEELNDVAFEKLDNIKSPSGFLRRLNDTSCIGCHQTRAIGGFHFTGKDPQGKYPGNSVFLPGSAHYFGDLPRRKLVQEQFINKYIVDYSRGFSARAKREHAQDLAGTGMYNGWGAHCSSNKNEASFGGWDCAEGLECQSLLDKSDGTGQGICLPKDRQNIGDPCEKGKIVTTSYGVENYVRSELILKSKDPNVMCSPQSSVGTSSSGGFLNGSVRMKTCDNMPKEAVCGMLPAAKPGFNACLGGNNFLKCIKEFATGVGLRGCDAENPCRDDYICTESYDPKRGACVPPYFLFQFRIDGHPLSK